VEPGTLVEKSRHSRAGGNPGCKPSVEVRGFPTHLRQGYGGHVPTFGLARRSFSEGGNDGPIDG